MITGNPYMSGITAVQKEPNSADMFYKTVQLFTTEIIQRLQLKSWIDNIRILWIREKLKLMMRYVHYQTVLTLYHVFLSLVKTAYLYKVCKHEAYFFANECYFDSVF